MNTVTTKLDGTFFFWCNYSLKTHDMKWPEILEKNSPLTEHEKNSCVFPTMHLGLDILDGILNLDTLKMEIILVSSVIS